MTEKKPLNNTEKSVIFRERNKELGRAELRGIYATSEEQKILKSLMRDKLNELRKNT